MEAEGVGGLKLDGEVARELIEQPVGHFADGALAELSDLAADDEIGVEVQRAAASSFGDGEGDVGFGVTVAVALGATGQQP